MAKKGEITYYQYELPSNSFAAFEDMRKSGLYCDFTIKVKDQLLEAHRVILAAGIPYFKSVLSAGKFGEKSVSVVDDVEPDILELLIHFAYTGKVTISSLNVNSLLQAARLLDLNQVQDACTAFLSKTLDVNNVLQVRSLANNLNNSSLLQNSNVYIRKHFDEFSKSDEFLNLRHSCVKEIISSDDLRVSSEVVVFEAVLTWVKFAPAERCVMLPDLLSEVRLTYLPLDYVMEQVESEELILASKQCRDLVNEAKHCHLLPERSLALPASKTQPRNHFNEELYAVCACFACGYSVHHLDSETGIWHVLSSKNVSFRGVNGAATVNGKIYIFPDKTIISFNPKTLAWEVLESDHEGMEGAAFVSDKKRIYCFGSRHGNLKSRVLCYDTELRQYLFESKMRSCRESPAAAALDGFIYVTGGYDGQKSLVSAERYNPSTGEWRDIAPMRVGRRNHCCISTNGKIYVCGGSGALESAEVYDPTTNKWNFISSMKSRNCRLLLSDHSNIYALTDSNYKTYNPRNHQCKQWETFLPGRFECAVTIPITNVQHSSA